MWPSPFRAQLEAVREECEARVSAVESQLAEAQQEAAKARKAAGAAEEERKEAEADAARFRTDREARAHARGALPNGGGLPAPRAGRSDRTTPPAPPQPLSAASHSARSHIRPPARPADGGGARPGPGGEPSG